MASPDSSFRLTGHKVNLNDSDLFGVTDIQVFDSILVLKCTKTSAPQMLHAFSCRDGQYYGSFVANGRGAGEALSPLMRGSAVSREGDILVDLFDLGQNSAYIWNLSESIARQRTVMSSSVKMKELTMNLFRKEDKYISFNPTHCSVSDSTQNVIDIIPMYPEVSGHSDKLSSCAGLNKHKNKLAMAMMMFPQVNFLDLDTKEKMTLAVTKDYRNWREVLGKENIDLNIYYLDCTQSDRSFFGLYINTGFQNWIDEDYDSQIHVFDWDCNFKYEIIVEEKLKAISYSPSNNVLYAVDVKDELYYYDLQGLIL